MKAVAYIRVSTQDQADTGQSLDDQAHRLQAYCQAHGLQLVDVVSDEGISGSTPFAQRAGGKQVMQHILNGVNNLVVLKFDRMFRNTVDALTMMKEFENLHTHLHALDFGGAPLSTNTPMGQFMLTMRAGFAQLERDLGRERTRDAMANMRRKGMCVGQVPFGYYRQGDQVVEDTRRNSALTRMRLHLGGGFSLRQIADFHNSDYPDMPVSASTVKRLLACQPQQH